jgi:hypothetical protein
MRLTHMASGLIVVGNTTARQREPGGSAIRFCGTNDFVCPEIALHILNSA